MELDAKKIERLRHLNEQELSVLLTQAATSMGVSERRAKLLARHSGSLQKKLATLTDAQIVQLFGMLGEEQGKQLFSQL